MGILPYGPQNGLNHLFNYAKNNPINYTDPEGNFAILPVATLIIAGYGVLAGTEMGVATYYDYRFYMELENQKKFILTQIESTNIYCETERYQFLKERLENLSLRQTALAEKKGFELNCLCQKKDWLGDRNYYGESIWFIDR